MKCKIYVFGDSHAEIFFHMNKIFPDSYLQFDVTSVGGATAQGMVNPNSQTNCLAIFNERISSIRDKNARLFFLLGEVDTGFVIWYRAQKHNESIESQMARSLDNYIAFLKQTRNAGFKNIIAVSAPLPTIKDGQDWGEVANLRKEIKASQKERTDLTLEYNKRLKSICMSEGFGFVDLDKELIDPSAGIIKQKFLNKDPNNHHLDIDEYAAVVFNKIEPIIRPDSAMHVKAFLRYVYYGVRNKFRKNPKKEIPPVVKPEHLAAIELKKTAAPRYNKFKIQTDYDLQPVWVLGMFRSGTSLICDILQELGADFGPETDLLHAEGVMKDLNPNGFFENFIFAEYSRFIYEMVNAKGDNPPTLEKIKSIQWKDVQIETLIDYTFHKSFEDRISLENKISAYRRLCESGLNGYLKAFSSGKPYIKIPMLSFLTHLLVGTWPNSRFLVVFRNPESVVKSSHALSKTADYDLYEKYNRHLLEFAQSNLNAFLVSYDRLIAEPEVSVAQLCDKFGLDKSKVKTAAGKVDITLYRNRPVDDGSANWPEKIRHLYSEMMQAAINSPTKSKC